ncbi:trihelix transcription factor GT-3b-like [Andrographis paniculata]|uniref:trihelix transcription factor GT-3b-like n=1 Tax=Andrographis paniculata TaxID=175694 RepID=UPI0021E972B9|nr:trihelix transcription factor GT-3b-like [Andrographis paniculata]
MDPGQLHHQYSAGTAGIDPGGGGGAADRLPQWSHQETKDFLMIRAELDPTFMETKRNKLLWEVISTRMKEKGYNRSGEQCKCKWKNLVTRYKGYETMEVEGMRQQFPFYNELQAIFAARMQRMLWLEAEGGGGGAAASSRKKSAAQPFSSDEEDENEESDREGGEKNVRKRRKLKTAAVGQFSGGGGGGGNTTAAAAIVAGIRETMEEFSRRQMQMEMEWMKAYDAREAERREREAEWRRRMAALEEERMMMERRWREREEQRRAREESRAERRDALVTALLNKLRSEDHHQHA